MKNKSEIQAALSEFLKWTSCYQHYAFDGSKVQIKGEWYEIELKPLPLCWKGGVKKLRLSK